MKPYKYFAYAFAIISLFMIGMYHSILLSALSPKIASAQNTALPCMPTGKQWYVSTTGSASGDGSFNNPWNLQTALKHAGPSAGIKPGDAVCIRGGVYNNANSKFTDGEYLTANLRGEKNAPIVVRAYPGEKVTIDLQNSPFYIGGNNWEGTAADLNKGHDMWIWGLEIMSSVSPHSDSTPCGGSTGNHCSWTALYSLVDIRAPRAKFINNVVHDLSTGVQSWRFAYETDVYGTVIFHNGWIGPDRGHGHGFYIENMRDRQYRAKEMEDNIVFENASNNIQAYAGGAEVANMKFLGNTLFNAGYLSGSYDYNFLVGSGSGPKQDFYIKDNMTYSTNDDSMTSIGWNWDYVNNNAVVDNNYFIGGSLASGMFNWYQGVFTNNTVYAQEGTMTQLNNFIDAGINQKAGDYVWNNNTYYGKNAFRISYNTNADRNYNGAVHGDTRDFNFWKTATGFDANSTYSANAPTGIKTFVRPNKYEPGRANVTVYNWNQASSISVDVSASGVKSGEPYKVFDVQNINGAPVASGVYTGGYINIPMSGLSKLQPRGGRTIAHTAPKFGVFVFVSGSAINGMGTSIPAPTATPPAPTPIPVPIPAPVPGAPMVINSFTASANQISSGGSFTLSWNVSDLATGGSLLLTGSDGLNGGYQPLIRTTGNITPTVSNTTIKYTLTPSSGSPASVNVTVGAPGAVTPPVSQPIIPPASGSLLMQSYNLNNFMPNNPVLDGQWQGIKYASDGNVYFGSSSHDARHGAAFFKFDPRTSELTMLAEDLTKVVGENPLTTPQGKLHSDILESNGWLYFATYFGNEGGYYSQYSGSHIIGYNLTSGQFKDFGIAKANYTVYSAIGMDPTGRYIYGFWTGRLDGQSSYLYKLDIQTGAYTNLGHLGGPASSLYMFVDQNGFVWFTVEYVGGTLFRYNPNTNQIEKYNNALPQIYMAGTGSAPSYLGSATDQSYRKIHWMQPIDGTRALFTMGYNGGRLYMLDATKQPGSGAEFNVVKDIGYTDLGLAVAKDSKRVFYYQRANRGCGHQADGQNQGFCGKPATELKDFHLMSVSYDPATNYAITDHGLLVDQNGRFAWRIPALATDGNNKVFGVGDWFTISGDIGSKNSYRPAGVNRSEFLAYTDVSRASVLPITTVNNPNLPVVIPPVTTSVGTNTTATQKITITVVPKPLLTNNKKPIGRLDGVKTDGTIYGWALDPDNVTKPVSVHLYLNAPMENANTTPIGTTASDFRSDIGVHGFNFQVPNQYQDGVSYTVYAYGLDLTDTSGTFTNKLIGSPSSFVLGSVVNPPSNSTPPISTTTSTAPPVAVPPLASAVDYLAYWSLDTNKIVGSSVQDLGSNGINLNMNNTTSTTGVFEQALVFNGSNSNLQTYSSYLSLTTDMTFSAWVKTTNTRTEALISKYDSAGSESGYMLKVNSNGNLELQVGNGNLAVYGGRTSTDTKKINDGAWHHVAVVISLGKDVKFYVDGVLSSTSGAVTKSGSNSAPFQIGSEPFGYYGNYFTGSVDDIKVWNTALNATDIQTLFNQSIAKSKNSNIMILLRQTASALNALLNMFNRR